MEIIKRYFELNDTPVHQRIDDSEAEDLNLDDLYYYLDYTISPIGKQYLYNLIRNIPTENIIEKFEDWLSKYHQDTVLKTKIEKLLKKLTNNDLYYIQSLFQQEQGNIPKHKILVWRVLQFLPAISCLIFILFHVKVAIIFALGFFIVNFCIHYKNKQTSFLYAGSITGLLRMLQTAERLSAITDDKRLQIYSTINNLKQIKKSLGLFRFEAKIESEAAALVWLISEFYRIFFLLEPIAFYYFFKELRSKKQDVRKIFEYIGLIDTLQSIDILRNTQADYCIPIISDAISQISAEEVYHPLITNCIRNSFSTDKNAYLIMGSNMSGKTTFIRTIAINTLTAQTLNTCFAKKFQLHKQKIRSCISLNDNLTEGQSYYLAEVLKIKSILEETDSGHNLIVLDELFKGTNTEERIAITKAVLTYLRQNENNIILASTHAIELSVLMGENKYFLTHFTEKIEDGKLTFPYKIHHGKPESRNAIKILELYGYPDQVIQDSKKSINPLVRI